jgi:DNA replication protein DnaC
VGAPLRAVEAGSQPVCQFAECDGSGWIIGPEDVARPCRCREKRMAGRRTRGVASALPKRYRDVSFELLRNAGLNSIALRAAEDYVNDLDEMLEEGRGLWLAGGVGNGKTSLAMLVSKKALEAGRSVVIYSMPKLLTRIRSTFNDENAGDSYSKLFERLTTIDLLHVDDLGAEKQSEWVLEQVYAIVNERYEAKRSMLITTNLDEKELVQQVGERTVSRLLEMCGYVEIPDGDRRPQLAPEL